MAPEGTPTWAGYVAHVVMYAALAAALLWTWRRRNWPWPGASSFLLALGYGALHEAVQALLPWRSATFFDLVADAVGAGLVVAWHAARRRQRRRRPARVS